MSLTSTRYGQPKTVAAEAGGGAADVAEGAEGTVTTVGVVGVTEVVAEVAEEGHEEGVGAVRKPKSVLQNSICCVPSETSRALKEQRRHTQISQS